MIVKEQRRQGPIKWCGPSRPETRGVGPTAKLEVGNGKNRTSVEKLLPVRVISFGKLSNFKVLHVSLGRPARNALAQIKLSGKDWFSLPFSLSLSLHGFSFPVRPQIELQRRFFTSSLNNFRHVDGQRHFSHVMAQPLYEKVID